MLLFCAVIWQTSYGQLMTNSGLSLTIESGITVTVEGGFTNQSKGSDGSLDNDGTLVIEGDWHNNAAGGSVTINADDTGTIELTGSVAQAVGGTRGSDFENLVINNTSTGGVTLSEDATVLTSLSLVDGIVFTNSTGLMIIADGATSTSGSDNSFVDGPIKKVGNDNFVFPTGDGTVWARIAIDNTVSNANTTEFTAQYFHTGFSESTTDGSLNSVSTVEYWTLSRAVVSSDVPVTLYWEDATRSDIPFTSSDLVVARYNGSSWSSEGQSSLTATDPGNVTSDIVTDFSNLAFTFGVRDSALPVELLFFAATPSASGVLLEWATLTELNNDFFTVEKSTNAREWTEIAVIDGAGNSQERKDYTVRDQTSLRPETVYYRLRQTDFDGTSTYSHIISVEISPDRLASAIYPSPASSALFIPGTAEKLPSVQVTDALGRDISAEIYLEFNPGRGRWQMDVRRLPSGVYTLLLEGRSARFIKN